MRRYPHEMISAYDTEARSTDTKSGLERLSARMQNAHDLYRSGLITLDEAVMKVRN